MGHLLLTVLLTLISKCLIRENTCIIVNEFAKSLGVSAGSAVKIMDTLGYSKVCARWVPRQLTEAHKHSHLEACSKLLEYCHSDKTFLQQIVTRDETCSKKFKSQKFAGKAMVTVFWDSVGVILVDFMSKRATINSNVYIDTLKKLKARIQTV